jgi:hypothetical protein
MEVLGIVLMFLAFVGEFGEFAVGLTTITRALSLIDIAVNGTLSIADVINNPADAPLSIIGAVLGLKNNRNPEEY